MYDTGVRSVVTGPDLIWVLNVPAHRSTVP